MGKLVIKCRLQEILDESGIKQDWLAKKIGVTNSSISTICSGKSRPSLESAMKIAKILNVRVDDIWKLIE